MQSLGMDLTETDSPASLAPSTEAATSLIIEDLRITASLARLNTSEAELEAAFPAFREMLSYFAAMQRADADENMLGSDGTAGVDMPPDHFRPDAAPSAKAAPELAETMLDNSGERDGRFIVVPNVL